MKKLAARTLLLQILLIIAILLSACTPKDAGVSQQNTEAPAGAAEATKPPEPTEPAAPASFPTARPLVDISAQAMPGEYVNDFLGVSLDYPKEWEVQLESQTGVELLMVGSSQNPVIVYLTDYFLETDMTLEESLIDYMQMLAENLELTEQDNIEIDSAYVLDNGLETWHGIMRSVEDSGTFMMDMIGTERAGRVFTLWFIGWEDIQNFVSNQLEDVRQSFTLFSPTPYGVDRENALFLPAGEPDTFDPAKYLGSADGYMGDIFSGLVRLDTSLQPIPDLAESWEVSSDGLVYTFHLRHNVTFHTGRPFTAEDVKFSWDRAASPEVDSPTVGTYLNDIVGVQEVIDGDAEEISGVKVIDDYTLEVTLDSPKVYFLSKLAYPTSWIVDQETVDDVDENPIGTGPFKMAKHDENEIMILARNENYHLGFVPLEYMVYLIYQGPSVRLYEGGQIDILTIDEDLLDRAKDSGDPLYGNVQSMADLCTSMVRLDSSMAPFDDPLVREAFARAIDKERYNSVVTEDKGVIANGLYPPGLPGFNQDVTPLAYDPTRAVQALAESSYGSAAALPEIVFTVSSGGSGIDPSDALLIDMWQQTLGVSITVEQIDYQDYLKQIMAGEHGQIVADGWCADYPDPENFADVLFHTGAPMNLGHYSNSEVDALLEQARSEPDVTARIALYQQIEQMLIDDVSAIFLMHGQAYYVVTKPYVQNYKATPIGVAQDMNISIEH